MAKYKWLPQDEYERLRVLAAEINRLVDRVAAAPSIEMELPTPARTEEKANIGEEVGVEKKYKVSRSDWSWADVAAKELSGLFSLDQAMDTLMPLIHTTASRPRDSLRVAMDRDNRFKRVERDGDIWYQRVDPSQTDMEVKDQG